MQGFGTTLKNREEAGQLLAEELGKLALPDDVLILALPRGGVPVAFEVAKALEASLDILLVRKLGVPGQEELAMGAISSGGVRVVNENVVAGLAIGADTIERVTAAELIELERRESLYRASRPLPRVEGRTVILVDDGIATGSTMRAAVELMRRSNAGKIVVAVPTAPPDTVSDLKRTADAVVTVMTPEPFYGVGRWYDDFKQISDNEVRHFLETNEQDSSRSEE